MMILARRVSERWIAALLALLLALAPGFAGAGDASSPSDALARHVLNRLAFGPRPGDVERVRRIGIEAYVEEQLSPDRVADESVEAGLDGFPTLRMTQAELLDRFERPLKEARRRRKEELARGESEREEEPTEQRLAKLRDLVPPENRPRRILEELSAARVVRAADSRRQLNEVLVDFWLNHFNVDFAKGADRFLLTSFERDVVRPRIWGKFEDLLLATAKSPAMLFYLDNARSVADAEHRPPGFRVLAAARPKAPTGLNENYARELLELHTLGVDGGYSERDVTELARVLTGWSIDRRDGADFVFRPALHDVGAKTVLGRTLAPGGGVEEGEETIRFLARHPSTARHIAWKLCQRFVADDPPPALVERVAKRFLATRGDLRETVREVVTSAEFRDPAFFGEKVKSPFEYAVSGVRALGGSTDGRGLAREIARMGEPLYACAPPTGYPEASAGWLSAGALVARLDFSLALAEGRIPGTRVCSGDVADGAGDGAAVLLAAPEFQKR